ncbi:MAG: PD40 domain-containing protein [Anaerolineae bacterium]|nr:PD40 domain-containing protein [Anaerolineae bacterium]
MRRTIRFRLFGLLCASSGLFALTLLSACNSPPATADLSTPPHIPDATSLPVIFFFHQKEAPNAYMQALMEGELVLVDGCLRIGGADGHVPIWPWDFALAAGAGDAQVVDGDGRIAAQIGDRLRLSGGEAPAAPLVEDAARPLLANCPGPYWIVGNEIERVAERPDASPSPATTVATAVEAVALSPTPVMPATPTPTPVSARSASLANAEGLIAFVDSERRLCLIKPNGRNLRQVSAVGEAFAPAWSPDGETLAYIYQESAEEPRRATLYRLDGGLPVSVGTPEQTLRSLAWSPDGRYLLLDSGTSMAGRFEVVHPATFDSVYRASGVGFAWSPDGGRLALGRLQPLQDPIGIESGDSVSLAILEIGEQTPRVILTGTPEVLYFPRAWLPDDKLLYDRLDWNESTGTGEYSQWTVIVGDEVGTPQPVERVAPPYSRDATLARLPEQFQNATTGSFSWSQDGRQLVFHTRLDGQMDIYLFDWEQGGEPVRLVGGTSPAWRPAPAEPAASVVHEGTLDCTPAGAFSHCVDDVLGIEFEVPASWAEIETRFRPGGYAGFAYDYYFGGKPYGATYPLGAGGRSIDFAEPRGAMWTDFSGYGHAEPQFKKRGCDPRWSATMPICVELVSDVAWMIRVPRADSMCEGDTASSPPDLPVFRIEIDLPDNSIIHGFAFEAPFVSERFVAQFEDELYPLLGISGKKAPSKCDPASRQAFDAQLTVMLERIVDGVADAETIEKVDELIHLAESILVWGRDEQ